MLKKRLILKVSFVIILFLILLRFGALFFETRPAQESDEQEIPTNILQPRLNKTYPKYGFDKTQNNLTFETRYANNVTVERLNRLFDILLEREKVYGHVLDELHVASFQQLIDGDFNSDKALAEFKDEQENFLKIENGKVTAAEKFIEFLIAKSDFYSFDSPRDFVFKAKIDKVKKITISYLVFSTEKIFSSLF